MMAVKWFIYFWLIACFALTLAACDRAIPSPGKVIMPAASDSFAENYMLGNSLYLHVKKATNCMKQYQRQTLRIDFLLGDQYTMRQIYRDSPLPLFNSGNYKYSIDYHEPHEGMLNLVSKGGWDILLSYVDRSHGTFFAHVARGKCRSRMNGSFRVVITNPEYPN